MIPPKFSFVPEMQYNSFLDESAIPRELLVDNILFYSKPIKCRFNVIVTKGSNNSSEILLMKYIYKF